jgi:hypothetical protein
MVRLRTGSVSAVERVTLAPPLASVAVMTTVPAARPVICVEAWPLAAVVPVQVELPQPRSAEPWVTVKITVAPAAGARPSDVRVSMVKRGIAGEPVKRADGTATIWMRSGAAV